MWETGQKSLLLMGCGLGKLAVPEQIGVTQLDAQLERDGRLADPLALAQEEVQSAEKLRLGNHVQRDANCQSPLLPQPVSAAKSPNGLQCAVGHREAATRAINCK